jgi:hypothetical protein
MINHFKSNDEDLIMAISDNVYLMGYYELVSRMVSEIDKLPVEQVGQPVKESAENLKKWVEAKGDIPMEDVGMAVKRYYNDRYEVVGMEIEGSGRSINRKYD